MSITIYRIHSIPSSTNAYTTGRMETWTMKPDGTYTNEALAREAVIAGNLKYSELSRFLIDLTLDERDDFIENFCFNSSHLHLQKVFLGKPSKDLINAIIKSVKDQGTSVHRIV